MYKYYSRGGYNRGGFVFPFLVGALSGGAAIGLTRPRPVYVNPGYPGYPMYQPYPYYGYYNRPY
jgi:hypothetical protein